MLAQLHRVLSPDGACSHTVDLKDHLGGGRRSTPCASRGAVRVTGLQTRHVPVLPTPQARDGPEDGSGKMKRDPVAT